MSIDDSFLDRLRVRLYSVEPSRRAANSVFAEARASLTPPPKGKIVGSDNKPDWSFPLSIIENDEFGRRGNFPTYKLLRNLIQPHRIFPKRNGYEDRSPHMTMAGHMKLEVVFTSKLGVRQWTHWAHAFGVTHNGQWGYKFPPKRVWNAQDSRVLDYITTYSSRGCGKRSISAAKRRKERRKLLSGLSADSIHTSEPLGLRNLQTARSVRSAWHSIPSDRRPKWSEFRPHVENRKVLSILPVRKHRPEHIPDLVLRALARIYSGRTFLSLKRSRVPRIVVSEPSSPLTTMHQGAVLSCRQDILNRLEAIELGGFKQTALWFNLNQCLTKLG